MKRVIAICFVVFFMLITTSNAKNDKPLYSRISTSFSMIKIVKCDKIKAKFEIYAEGDNYEMALKRIKKLNNKFLGFLKKRFNNEEIQTSSLSNYSKKAVIYITVNTNKPKKIQEAFGFISNSSFEYKTGIRVIFLKPYVSNRLKQKTENSIFKRALIIAKEKLKTINTELGERYKIQNVRINFSRNYQPYREASQAILYKSKAANGGIDISSGSQVIRAYINADFIKTIK